MPKLAIEPITLEHFRNLTTVANRINEHSDLSPEHLALRQLEVGTAIILEHGNYRCFRYPEANGKAIKSCTLTQIGRREAERRGLLSVSRHLPDGRIAIAYVVREVR